MSRIKLKDKSSVDAESLDIFSEIESMAGAVPAAYRAFANHSHILQANWNRTKNILGQGNIPIEIKEAIATRVSAVNGCSFCLVIHKGNLEKLGFDNSEIEDIEHGKVQDLKLGFILGFVTTATTEPHKLADSDFHRLMEYGYSDEDILEILTVMEMYTGYNKIIVALDLKHDD